MIHSAEFNRCMVELDVPAARALWAVVFPHLPAPSGDAATLAMLHYARTISEPMRFRLRAYSHAWLGDHGFPSGLPDELKPRAERLYPRIVDAVGIAVKTPPHRRELGVAVHDAMRDVVMNHYADGIHAPEIIRPRMLEARALVHKRN